MPTVPAIIPVNYIQQHIHNWLYSIGPSVDIVALLINYYPKSAEYINYNHYDYKNEDEKLQFLIAFNKYLECEILGFKTTNANTKRPITELFQAIESVVYYRLYLSPLQVIIANFINYYSRGLEVSLPNIQRLQEEALRRISAISNFNPDNEAKRKLLILCGQLVLTRILFEVYAQRIHVDYAVTFVNDLNVFLNNAENEYYNYSSLLSQDFEIFSRICCDLGRLDILEGCIRYGLRLPGNPFFLKLLADLSENDDPFTVSVIKRFTSLDVASVPVVIEEALVVVEETPVVIKDASVVPEKNTIIVELSNQQLLEKSVAAFNSAEFNHLINKDVTLLNATYSMLENLIASEPSPKRAKQINKFIMDIQISLEFCEQLLEKTNNNTFFIIHDKIASILKNEFQAYLNSDSTKLPEKCNKLMLKELHAAIYNLDIDKIKFLISKGADYTAKDATGKDGISILLTNVAHPDQINEKVIAIAQAMGIDLIHSPELSLQKQQKAEKLPNGAVLFKHYNNEQNPKEFLDIFGKIKNQTDIKLQTLLAYINHTDSTGRPLVTICLQRGFTDLALSILEKATFTSTPKDSQRNTLLHTWAQYTPTNMALLKLLLCKYDAPTKNPCDDLNSEHGDSFVHTLLRNQNVTETIALNAFSIIFLSTNNDPSRTAYFLRTILATKNNNKNTTIGIAEIRGWKAAMAVLSFHLTNIIKLLERNQINISQYFEYALDYFNQNSTNNLIIRKLQNKDYKAIQQLIENREQIRNNIKNVATTVKLDDDGAFYSRVFFIFGGCEYNEMLINDKILINHIYDMHDTSNPNVDIQSIMDSSLVELLKTPPLTQTICWQQIFNTCKERGLTQECIQDLEKLSDYAITSKVDPTQPDVFNMTMLDDAAILGDINLIKDIVTRFNFTAIKPKTLFHACEALLEKDTDNHSVLEYLVDLYEKSRLKNPSLPTVAAIINREDMDLLSYAALHGRNISKFSWLQQRVYASDRIYNYNYNLLQLILRNTGNADNLPQLDVSYTLQIIKLLLTTDKNANEKLVTNRDSFGYTALEQAVGIKLKSTADIEPQLEILELLIANGADLLNETSHKQNILHCLAGFTDNRLTDYIETHIKRVHGNNKVREMQKKIDENRNSPITLIERRVKTQNKLLA